MFDFAAKVYFCCYNQLQHPIPYQIPFESISSLKKVFYYFFLIFATMSWFFFTGLRPVQVHTSLCLGAVCIVSSKLQPQYVYEQYEVLLHSGLHLKQSIYRTTFFPTQYEYIYTKKRRRNLDAKPNVLVYYCSVPLSRGWMLESIPTVLNIRDTGLLFRLTTTCKKLTNSLPKLSLEQVDYILMYRGDKPVE